MHMCTFYAVSGKACLEIDKSTFKTYVKIIIVIIENKGVLLILAILFYFKFENSKYKILKVTNELCVHNF